MPLNEDSADIACLAAAKTRGLILEPDRFGRSPWARGWRQRASWDFSQPNCDAGGPWQETRVARLAEMGLLSIKEEGGLYGPARVVAIITKAGRKALLGDGGAQQPSTAAPTAMNQDPSPMEPGERQ